MNHSQSSTDATTSATAGLRVQRKQCATCIYLPVNADMIPRLEAQIADPKMPGHFDGHRVCHHAKTAVCAGFWARHKDDFSLGQIAQRLGFVQFVQDEDRDA